MVTHAVYKGAHPQQEDLEGLQAVRPKLPGAIGHDSFCCDANVASRGRSLVAPGTARCLFL